MRLRDRQLAERLEAGLIAFSRERRRLIGIENTEFRTCLVEQLVESVRRIRYVAAIGSRDVSRRRGDPIDALFDPLRAAVLQRRDGNFDEAFWLVFLFVHFGKHPRAGYQYARDIYGRLGDEGFWNWPTVRDYPDEFRAWLQSHESELRSAKRPHGFGNHRKYESLDAYSPRGTGAAVTTYVEWVRPWGTHEGLIKVALEASGGEPERAFDELYQSMGSVASFGRLAKFDYLTMVSKLELAPIYPGSAYMEGSTGPVKGGRLLFDGGGMSRLSPGSLDSYLRELGSYLQVGMQVLEDALCNWQKNPSQFIPFRG